LSQRSPGLIDRPKTYAFRELRNLKPQPDTDTIIEEGILRKNSMMIIGGPPKSYKSFISNTIAIDLVVGHNLFTAIRYDHGRPFKAFNVVSPQRVLIFEQEIGEEDMKARLGPIYDSLLPESRTFLDNGLFTHSLDHHLQLDKPEGAKLIRDEIASVKPSVVIFDPLIEFHTSDENNTQAMAIILRNLDLIREEMKCAVIINHHEGKQTAIRRTGGDRLRGNSVLYGKGDTFLMLQVLNRNASMIGCDFTVRRGKPIRDFRIKLNPVTMRADFMEWGKEERAKSMASQKSVGAGQIN
jgi:RecA-family ATPase